MRFTATVLLSLPLSLLGGVHAHAQSEGIEGVDGSVIESEVEPASDAVLAAEPDEAAEPADPASQAGGAPADPPRPRSGVRGRVVDASSGEGIADAVVLARTDSATESAITDAGGSYVLALAPGAWSVLAYTGLYHGARVSRVDVPRARFTDLDLTLTPLDAEAVREEVEIVYRADTASAAAQDQLRAASGGIGDGMGAAQMSAAGASDAGGAARGVAGVTLEGTSLNVRGLGGRYTLVLLNGAPLPSTDPDVPSVDLDLFPTRVLERLELSKAFLPDLPGNFAGGVLDLHTVRFPRELTLSVEASAGFDSQATFQDVLTYQGGGLDALGIDDGTRAFPTGLDERLSVSRSGRYQSFTDLERAAERFSNVWSTRRTMGVPPLGLGAVLGDSISLGGGNRLGFLITADYDYAHRRGTGTARPRPTIAEDGSLVPFNEYELEWGTESVQLSSFGTVSLELGPRDVLSYVTLFHRTADDETQRQIGHSGELGGNVERWQLQMVARTLSFHQLRGDHQDLFGSRARLRWSLYGAYAAREEPDRRSVTYGPQGSLTRWLEKSQSGERFYSDLDQRDFGGTLDLRLPLWTGAHGSLGAHLRTSDRDFVNRRVRMLQDPSATDQTAYQGPPEELFSEQGIGSLTRMQEYTLGTDGYTSAQRAAAGYLMLETPLGDALTFTGGARLEVLNQTVESHSPFASEQGEDDAVGTDRTDVDVLPGGALRLQLAEGMVLRGAYGMTVGRPHVRELAPYQYYDFLRDRNVSGNPELARTLVQNADLRWEWFFGEGELLAASVFYKYFDRPIELQIRNQMTYDSQYINADEAHNVGGEVEARVNLRRLHPALEVLTLSGNFTAMWSTVRLPDALSGAVSAERPLVGQSPYVANLSLSLDEPETGIFGSLVYNLTGPRITDVGTRVSETVLPSIQREAFHSLDLVLGVRFAEHLRLRLRVRNLLYQPQEHTQGDFLTQRTDPNVNGSLSLEYSH